MTKIQQKKMKITQLLTDFAQLLTDFVDVLFVRKHTKLRVRTKKQQKNKQTHKNRNPQTEQCSKKAKISLLGNQYMQNPPTQHTPPQ